MIETDNKKLSLRRQCELLGLPRSSYYRNQAPETQENDELMRMIDEEYTRHPFLGSRGMRDYLRRQEYKVNRKRVRRLMRVMGLASIAPQKRTSIPAPGHKVYPYLLRKLDISMEFPWFRRHLKVMVRSAFKRLGTYAADIAMSAPGHAPPPKYHAQHKYRRKNSVIRRTAFLVYNLCANCITPRYCCNAIC